MMNGEIAEVENQAQTMGHSVQVFYLGMVRRRDALLEVQSQLIDQQKEMIESLKNQIEANEESLRRFESQLLACRALKDSDDDGVEGIAEIKTDPPPPPRMPLEG